MLSVIMQTFTIKLIMLSFILGSVNVLSVYVSFLMYVSLSTIVSLYFFVYLYLSFSMYLSLSIVVSLSLFSTYLYLFFSVYSSLSINVSLSLALKECYPGAFRNTHKDLLFFIPKNRDIFRGCFFKAT